jgi:hypothetical protein
MVFFLQSAVVGRILDQTKCSMLTDGAHLSFSKEDTTNMKNRQVAAGERVEFKCIVVGAPLANIRWKVRIVARCGNIKKQLLGPKTRSEGYLVLPLYINRSITKKFPN